ncbi:hypothetical protein CXG81DRAFT_13353, partial [Caulochytrium protostelioides]
MDQCCGPESCCVNRSSMMECDLDDSGPAGTHRCRNRRLQQREYAPIHVIQTRKKGYGLVSSAPLDADALVMEYVGEVIPYEIFMRRTREYAESGETHFYFMALVNGEYIDALRRGNLARFMNHSCDPNCVLQKWIIGKSNRMGIFTKRPIAPGEELTFDYRFQRYGDKAQPCYCGSHNCSGFIG